MAALSKYVSDHAMQLHIRLSCCNFLIFSWILICIKVVHTSHRFTLGGIYILFKVYGIVLALLFVMDQLEIFFKDYMYVLYTYVNISGKTSLIAYLQVLKNAG